MYNEELIGSTEKIGRMLEALVKMYNLELAEKLGTHTLPVLENIMRECFFEDYLTDEVEGTNHHG